MHDPLVITLYNSKHEGTEYEQPIITLEMLMEASKLEEMLSDDGSDAEFPKRSKIWWWLPWNRKKPRNKLQQDIIMLADFVVALFGNQFSREQAMKGADYGELMTVVNAVNSRADRINQTNPTEPRQWTNRSARTKETGP